MTRLWVIAVLTVGVVVACDKVPLTSPTGSTITLSIDRDVVPLGGTAKVTAVVTEVAGTAVQNGTLVTFSPTIGRTDPVEAETVNGKATVTFIAGTVSGSGTINAFSGAAKTGSGNSSAGGVAVKVGSAGAERITVRAEPATVPATGGTVTVIANVQDAGGNGLPTASVNFTADNGTLSANSGITDAAGEARVTLTTSKETKVSANVGTKNATDFTIKILPAPAIAVGSCTASPNVGVAVTCTVTPTIATGGSPIVAATINWGDGSPDVQLGSISAATPASHTYSRADTFTVAATATDAAGQTGRGTASVAVTRQIPSITISGSSTGTVGTATTFTIVPPSSSTLPAASVVVDFGDGTSRNLGAISGSTTVSKIFSAAGTYVVTATVTDTAGTRNSASTSILISGAAGPTVSFTQDANAVGGCAAFTLTLTPASGTTITTVLVGRDSPSATYYTGTTSTKFATCGLTPNVDILSARVTDSTGVTVTQQLLVK